MSMMEVTLVKCPECDTLFDIQDVEATDPVYECSSCGEVFTRSNSYDGDSHKCPQCGKFGSKVEDTCCPDCEAPINVPRERIEGFQCPECEGYFEEDTDPCPNCGHTDED
ncbi:MAG: hypothetical protein QUS07_07220 [Methanothrix sp.]|nr:hypothetical protein [Methanothrix sp.]